MPVMVPFTISTVPREPSAFFPLRSTVMVPVTVFLFRFSRIQSKMVRLPV